MRAGVELSAVDARHLALRAQGLDRQPRRVAARAAAAAVSATVRRLGAVQLDTIAVLARSHELVPLARLGPVPRAAIEAGLWGEAGATFEYWAHAASVLPLEEWPVFAARRRRSVQRHASIDATARIAEREVLTRLRDLGPLDSAGLGGAGAGGEWWDWSPAKLAVERLLARGEVVCRTRRRWRRIYDLPERAIAACLLAVDLDDAACYARLVGLAAERLGVATVNDLADYFRIPVAVVGPATQQAGLVQATVEGWPAPAWCDPHALEGLGGREPLGRSVLLSPFDSLVWDRRRTARVFGFSHRLEAYTPAARRVHGYFAMPLLHRGRLCGRVDPVRRGAALVARQVSVEPRALVGMARALLEAAAWVGAAEVVVEQVAGVDPHRLRDVLRALRR
ncbi:MAG: winged helix-turn-helix domain-containing protein [Candidatus Dormibacteria bacterium]